MKQQLHHHLSIFALVLFLWHAPVHAQTYPVQTHVVTSGPYFNYLSYYGDQNNHLQVIVTLLDFNLPPVMARLRIRIEGPGYELYTNPNAVVGQPFLLEGGVPVNLSGIDLLPYLQQNNLIVSPQGLDINALPEGFTTICVDVIKDGTNQEVLSTNNCTAFPLMYFGAPTISPFHCGTTLTPDQLFYNLDWLAPLGYTPDGNSTLSYNFALYQWTDTNNFAIFQSAPFQGQTPQPIPGAFMVDFASNIGTNIHTIDANSIPLELGQKYVWYVQAVIQESNGSYVNMIANNGISTPCTFKYGESLSLAEVLTDGLYIDLFAEPSAENKGKAYWTVIDNTPNEGLSTFDQFFVEYRKQPQGNEGYEMFWFPETVTDFDVFIYQLEPSTTYEVRVSGVVGGVVGDPTPVKTFTTPAARVYACGESDLPFLPSTFTPLQNATAGIQVQIGQFKLDISEITPTGSTGHYEGKGTIPIAFLAGAKAKVRFDDILIDTEYRVREGRVDVITQGLENWLLEQYEQFIDPIYVNGTVDSTYVDSNGVAWVVVDGVNQSFTFDPPTYPIIINDASGYQYTIYPNGTVVISIYLEVSEYWTVSPSEVVHFGQNENEARGFDGKEFMQWHEQYEVMQLSDSTFYFVANKSMAANESDVVNVQLPPINSGVSFQFADGSPVTSTSLNGAWLGDAPHGSAEMKTLNIPARSAGDYQIHAYANNTKVGQLNISVYEKKEEELIVVPLVSNFNLTDAQIEAELDATLGEANIDVDVEVAPQWVDTTNTYTASTTISLPTEVGLLTKYSDDMKALRDAYLAANPNADKTKFYLFVVAGFDDPSEMGYMVRGRSMGFLRAGNPKFLETLSHELGHGMGALEHSWKNNGPDETTTSNLMDYASLNAASTPKNNLTKAQWRELRDADFVPSLFDEVEDGGLVSFNALSIPASFKNPDGSMSFYSPSGQFITLPPAVKSLSFSIGDQLYYSGSGELFHEELPIGCLVGFVLMEDGQPIEFKLKISNATAYYENESTVFLENTEVVAQGNGNQNSSSNAPTNIPYKDQAFYRDFLTKYQSSITILKGYAFFENGQFGFNLFKEAMYNLEAIPTMITDDSSYVDQYAFSGTNILFPVDWTRIDSDWQSYAPYYHNAFSSSFANRIEIGSFQGLSINDFSQLAQDFLTTYSNLASSKFGFSSILISIANKLNSYAAFEDYSSCLISDLNQPVQEFDFADKFLPGFYESYFGYDVNGWQQDNSLTMDIFNLHDKLTNASASISGSQDIEIVLNNQLKNAVTSAEVAAILNNYDNSPELCELTLIDLTNRLKAIHLLKNDEPNIGYVAKLTASAMESSQRAAVYDEFFKNNGALYEQCVATFTNLVNDDNYDVFMHALLKIASDVNVTKETELDIHDASKMFTIFMVVTEVATSDDVRFNYRQSDLNCFSCSDGGHIATFKYDEYIRLSLSHFDNPDLETFFADHGLDRDDLILPAFYLKYLYENYAAERDFKQLMGIVRFTVNTAAIILAIPSGGSSLTLGAALTIGMSSLDLVMQYSESTLDDTQTGQAILDYYNGLMLIDLGNGLFRIGMGITKQVANGVSKIKIKHTEIINGLESSDPTMVTKARQSYQIVFNSYRKINNFSTTLGQSYRSLLLKKLDAAYLRTQHLEVLNSNYTIDILNDYTVTVNSSLPPKSILTLENNSDGFFLKGNIDETSGVGIGEEVAKFSDVRYRNATSSAIKEGDLSVIRKSDGTFAVVRSVLMDNIYNAQKAIVNQWKNVISTATSQRKGNFGEMGSDVVLTEKGYQALHTRMQNIDETTHQGIDGVFLKDGEYFIVESKYHGTATLSTLANGTKQMSDDWILGVGANNRLFQAVGGNQSLYDDIINSGYRRLLAEIAPDGTVIYKELDSSASLIGNFTP